MYTKIALNLNFRMKLVVFIHYTENATTQKHLMQKFIQWEISLGICNFTSKQKTLVGEEFGKEERE